MADGGGYGDDFTNTDRLQSLRLWDALDAYAATLAPKLRDAFLDAIRKLRADITDAELENVVAGGDIDTLLAKIDWTEVQHVVRDAVVAVAEKTPTGFPTANGGTIGAMPSQYQVRFDILQQTAVDALRTYESKAIAILEESVREGAAQWIQIGLERGWNPRYTATLMRDMIGLPPNLVRATNSFRTLLESGDKTALMRALRDKRFDPTVRAAINAGQPLPRDKVDRMVERYRARALQSNAETIARTATMDALVEGQRLTWEQAIASGKVQESSVRRFWIIARDERVCPHCRPIPAMNTNGRGMKEMFVTPMDGYVLQPTLHFRCRCIIYYKIIEF